MHKLKFLIVSQTCLWLWDGSVTRLLPVFSAWFNKFFLMSTYAQYPLRSPWKANYLLKTFLFLKTRWPEIDKSACGKAQSYVQTLHQKILHCIRGRFVSLIRALSTSQACSAVHKHSEERMLNILNLSTWRLPVLSYTILACQWLIWLNAGYSLESRTHYGKHTTARESSM